MQVKSVEYYQHKINKTIKELADRNARLASVKNEEEEAQLTNERNALIVIKNSLRNRMADAVEMDKQTNDMANL